MNALTFSCHTSLAHFFQESATVSLKFEVPRAGLIIVISSCLASELKARLKSIDSEAGLSPALCTMFQFKTPGEIESEISSVNSWKLSSKGSFCSRASGTPGTEQCHSQKTPLFLSSQSAPWAVAWIPRLSYHALSLCARQHPCCSQSITCISLFKYRHSLHGNCCEAHFGTEQTGSERVKAFLRFPDR